MTRNQGNGAFNGNNSGQGQGGRGRGGRGSGSQNQGNGGRGGNRSRRGSRNGNNSSADQQNTDNRSGAFATAMLSMFRADGATTPETLQSLRLRANQEYGVVPCSKLAVGTGALRTLGFSGRTLPALSIQMAPVQAADANAPGAFTIIGSASGIGVGIRVTRIPSGAIAIIKKDEVRYWVTATPVPNGQQPVQQGQGANAALARAAAAVPGIQIDPDSVFTWYNTGAANRVSAEELVRAEHRFRDTIPAVGINGNMMFADAGPPVAFSLEQAMSGNAAAILRCAQWLGKDTVVAPPTPFFKPQSNTPMPMANLAFAAWLGRFALLPQVAARDFNEISLTIS